MTPVSTVAARVLDLPMYDLAEVQAANDVLAAGFLRHAAAAGLTGLPAGLARFSNYAEAWTSPDLLLAQTCGFPLTHELVGKVRLVATPDYEAPGCAKGRYCSFFVVRQDDPARSLADLRGRRAIGNAEHSQSGFNVLRHAVAPLAREGRFFSATHWSGGHPQSLAALQAGEGDVAAIDCVTFALMARYRPSAVAGLRVLGRSAVAPCLPYITRPSASDDDVVLLQTILQAVLDDPDLAAARAALLLKDFLFLPLGAYDPIVAMEQAALARNYRTLS